MYDITLTDPDLGRVCCCIVIWSAQITKWNSYLHALPEPHDMHAMSRSRLC